MPSLKGTQTEKNLLIAFAGESMARNRYTYFASVAKKEGYVLISAMFEETANQEKEHAKRLFKFLEGGNAEITATFPAGVIGDTAANLKSAAEGENEEWTDMYPKYAAIAREEGFPVIAAVMENIAVAEKQHEKQYLDLLAHLEAGTMFQRGDKVIWRCRNCGFIHEGTENIAVAEKQHEKQYLDLLAHLEAGTMFQRGDKVIWRCRNCGFIHEGTVAPKVCPACNHPQAHFEVLRADY